MLRDRVKDRQRWHRPRAARFPSTAHASRGVINRSKLCFGFIKINFCFRSLIILDHECATNARLPFQARHLEDHFLRFFLFLLFTPAIVLLCFWYEDEQNALWLINGHLMSLLRVCQNLLNYIFIQIFITSRLIRSNGFNDFLFIKISFEFEIYVCVMNVICIF